MMLLEEKFRCHPGLSMIFNQYGWRGRSRVMFNALMGPGRASGLVSDVIDIIVRVRDNYAQAHLDADVLHPSCKKHRRSAVHPVGLEQ